jgi:hypothetical protein
MRAYSGRCRGGPWDGKDLEAERRTYKVAIIPPLTFDFRNTVKDQVELKYGHYEHVLGQWVWHADS